MDSARINKSINKKLWSIVAASTAAVLVVAGAAVHWLRSAHQSQTEQSAIAERAHKRAAEAEKIADSDFDESTLPDCPAGGATEAATWSEYPLACVDRNSPDQARAQIAHGAQTDLKITQLSIPSGTHNLYAELKYSATGFSPAERPVLVCAHGLGADYHDCEQITEAAAQHGFAVLAFDFYGGSTRSKSGGSMEGMTIDTEKDDLLSVIKFMRTSKQIAAIANAKKLYLTGASQGGLVATMAAAQLQKEDAQVDGIVLYYPAFSLQAGAILARQQLGDEAAEALAKSLGFPASEAYLNAAITTDGYALAKHVTCPVMIIQGQADPVVPEEFSRKALAAFPDAKLVLLPGEKHGFTADGTTLAGVATLALLRAQ